jgi:hypothetical protein
MKFQKEAAMKMVLLARRILGKVVVNETTTYTIELKKHSIKDMVRQMGAFEEIELDLLSHDDVLVG